MKRLFTRPSKGESLCSHEVRKNSKKWSLQDWKDYEQFLSEEQITDQALWEIYLKKLETPLRELLIEPEQYDFLSGKLKAQFLPEDEKVRKGPYLKYKKHLYDAIKTLSDREWEVIEGIFWDQKTQRQLARKMNISKTVVAVYAERAMKKIKAYILNIQNEQQCINRRVSI